MGLFKGSFCLRLFGSFVFILLYIYITIIACLLVIQEKSMSPSLLKMCKVFRQLCLSCSTCFKIKFPVSSTFSPLSTSVSMRPVSSTYPTSSCTVPNLLHLCGEMAVHWVVILSFLWLTTEFILSFAFFFCGEIKEKKSEFWKMFCFLVHIFACLFLSIPRSRWRVGIRNFESLVSGTVLLQDQLRCLNDILKE